MIPIVVWYDGRRTSEPRMRGDDPNLIKGRRVGVQ